MKQHPRIALLCSQALKLPVDDQYREAHLESIDTQRGEILARPRHAPHEGWNDPETRQQVALSGMMERALQEKYGGELNGPGTHCLLIAEKIRPWPV